MAAGRTTVRHMPTHREKRDPRDFPIPIGYRWAADSPRGRTMHTDASNYCVAAR